MADSEAQAQDVVNVLLRSLSPAESEAVDGLLSVAWGRLLIMTEDLSARIDSGQIPASVVTGIQAEMVANVFKNPKNLRQHSSTRSIDDYSETDNDTFDSAVSSGQLLPTEAHLKLLARRKRGAFTIVPQ